MDFGQAARAREREQVDFVRDRCKSLAGDTYADGERLPGDGADGSEKAWDAGSISTLQSKRSVASAILHVPFLALPQLFSPGAPPQAGFFARSRAAKAGHAEERSRADACSCLILPACSHAPANTCCTSISLTLSHVEEHKQVPALVDRPACARRIPRYLIRVAARQHCRCSGLPSRA